MVPSGLPLGGISALKHEDANLFSPPGAFGPFRVMHQIGIGVLGPVFRTYDPESDRLVGHVTTLRTKTPGGSQRITSHSDSQITINSVLFFGSDF